MASKLQGWSIEDLERRAGELSEIASRKERHQEEADKERGILAAIQKELQIRRGSIQNATRNTFRLIGWTDEDVERYTRLHGEPEYVEAAPKPQLPVSTATFYEEVSRRTVSGEAYGPYESGEYYFVVSDEDAPFGEGFFAPAEKLEFVR